MRRLLTIAVIIFLVSCAVVQCRRGGGGGGRSSSGGGRSSSSSSGSSSSRSSSSRGSSSSSSSSRSSSSRGSSSSSSSRWPSSSTYVRQYQPSSLPKPSAPIFPAPSRTNWPSAPKLPSSNQPDRQPAYNPSFINPPSYPSYMGLNLGSDLGAPPAFPALPSYPGTNFRPPPYPGLSKPLEPSFRPSGIGNVAYPRQPGSPNSLYPHLPDFPVPSIPSLKQLNTAYPRQPGSVNAAYPRQPGSVNAAYPRQPGSPSAPHTERPNVAYPRQPGSVNAAYPRQPGSPSAPHTERPNVAYPRQPGSVNAAYPRQPGSPSAPYPQQPNVAYPRQPASVNEPYAHQPGSAHYPRQPGQPPVFVHHSGLPTGSNPYVKPYKKRGFLGQILSMGKGGHKTKVKYNGLQGVSGSGKSAFSPAMYPIMPIVMKKKKHKFFSPSFGRPSFFYMPHYGHSYGHWHHHHHHLDIDHEEYKGRCIRPIAPKNGLLDCNTTELGAKCTTKCRGGYKFADNTTYKENECWHFGGVWRPVRNFPACKPICTKKCQNRGRCTDVDKCSCPPAYRGPACEYHFTKCDLLKLVGDRSAQLRWSCKHGRNETVCKVRCRIDLEHFAEDPKEFREYRCSPEGQWSSESIPQCLSDEDKVDKDTVDGSNKSSKTTVTIDVPRAE